ncbi:MAG: response regulator [Phycisphaerales bacterium]|nr:response regulator [Phycisphaerales bacterium]
MSSVRANSRLNLLLSYGGWQDESWVDRLPRLLEPMGVRSVRASSGAEASEVIRTVPIHIAVVDLALPIDRTDTSREGGCRLLDLLRHLPSPPPTVVVKRARSMREDARAMTAAVKAGAFAVVDRPSDITDLEGMLAVLRRCMARYYEDRWPTT